jgi:CMP-N,N'-diacetyllegionaminic acid synthase
MADAGARILAVIPARGGSKRLPRKNVLPLAGRPLIDWSIRAAIDSGTCADILVSTDDAEIADVARAGGALVPWLRPAELSHDSAGTAPVLTHALNWYEQQHGAVDAVLLLQPTSPFRTIESVRAACAAFTTQPGLPRHPVVSVSPAASHPAWTFYLHDGAMDPCLGWDPLSMRSQDLPRAYALNGALYVIPAEDVRQGRQIVRPGVIPYVMTDPAEGLDIDTPDDWNEAERLASRLRA